MGNCFAKESQLEQGTPKDHGILENIKRIFPKLDSVKEQGILEGFKRLFPKLDAFHEESPVHSEIMLSVCNIVHYAFEAYKDPNIAGFTELTSQGPQIKHLNYDLTNRAVEGVLKIHLKSAQNVIESDCGRDNHSDPYVVFSAGSSCVRSEAVEDEKNPVWDSTHYLVLRKHHFRSDFSGKMRVAMFDDDYSGGGVLWRTIANQANKDDFLGSGEIDLEQLKRPGVHSIDLELKRDGESPEHEQRVLFTVEYISFKDACADMGIGKESKKWIPGVGQPENPVTMLSDISWIVNFGVLQLNPFAFIHVPSTDTQAWLHVNYRLKTLLVSFRGTETDKIHDILTDLNSYQRKLGATCQSHYSVEANSALKDKKIRVHSGFLKAYESIREAILQVIYDITGWTEDWNICLTGHSLGGALATLCAFECKNRKGANGSGPVIGMMNFGCPRVGNSQFAHMYDKTVVDTFRVVDKDDIVHLIPPYYSHTARELLCLPNGDVFIGGVPLSEVEHSTFTHHTRSRVRNLINLEMEKILEDILKKYRREPNKIADKHFRENYFSIIGAAARKFFKPHEAETHENEE